MDFLPYPDDPAQPGIEVLFLCSDENLERYVPQEVDSMDLSSFINNILMRKASASEDSLEVAVLAQACIYFRILRKLVGDKFDFQQFISAEISPPGRQIITLKRLEEACGWDKRWFLGRDDIFEQLLGDLYWEYRPAPVGFFECVSFLEALDSICGTIGFSIWVLLWSISPRKTSQLNNFRRGIRREWLEHRLETAGWCPYWIQVYAQRLSPFQMYYLSGIPDSYHPGHAACQSNKPCTVNDVDYGTYKTKHIPGCNEAECRFRGVEGNNLHRLASIISDGGIPLIRLRPQDDRADALVEVEVVKHTYGKPFIAISHVWSGGLGHFSANTLPQCQLDYLYRSTRFCKQKLYGESSAVLNVDDDDDDEFMYSLEMHLWSYPVYLSFKSIVLLLRAMNSVILGATGEDSSAIYLWIDTLCIPADPEICDQKYLQKKAIDSMALIYSTAMQVLVIDQSVKQRSLKSESGLALAAELLTCPWMTRSWTYQEGCLSRQTTFLLEDGLVNPRSQHFPNTSHTAEKKTSIFEKVLMDEILEEFNNMPDVMNSSVIGSSSGGDPLFIQIWNELSTRRTSIPDDLHGLLAVLLGLSAQEILGQQMPPPELAARTKGEAKRVQESDTRPPAERMLASYMSQPCLPLSMLFTPFPQNTPMCNSNDWMPRFPTGLLDLKFGTMAWDASGINHSHGLRFSLQESNLWALIPECSVETLSQERLPNPIYLSSPDDEKYAGWLSVSLNPHSPESIRPPDSIFCLVMHAKTNVGACFLLSDKENMEESRLHLKFICPLTWQIHLTTRDSQMKADGSSRAPLPARFVMESICILDCSKSNDRFVNGSTNSLSQIFPRLEAVAERVWYERLAKSLDSVSVEDLEASEQPTRLGIEPSYQFPRPWLIWIPIGFAVYMVAAMDLMNRYAPLSWQYGWENAVRMFWFKAIGGELVGRLAVERIWRYFRLDLPKRKLS